MLSRVSKSLLLPVVIFGVCIVLIMHSVFNKLSTMQSAMNFVKSNPLSEKTSYFWSDAEQVQKEVTNTNCKLNLLTNEQDFKKYFRTIEGECKEWKHFGSGSGRKFMCVDPKYNIVPGRCTVLSFGINNEWSFDDGIDKFNCKLYAFDPSMDVKSHQRSPNIYFTNVGVGNLKGKQEVGTSKNRKQQEVDTFEHLLQQVGVANKTIDYLKMDIDFTELNFFMQVFIETPYVFKHIKQIGMEVHPPREGGQGLGFKSEYQLFWLAFQMLRCHGFKLSHSRQAGSWNEVVWTQDGQW